MKHLETDTDIVDEVITDIAETINIRLWVTEGKRLSMEEAKLAILDVLIEQN